MRRIEALEAIRGLAAVYVAIGHFVLQVVQPHSGLVRLLFSFGQEAVVVFFLLSGFVIELSAGRKWAGVGDYVRRRAVRIYPIYLVALLAAFLATGIFGGGWNPEPGRLFGNIFMLQDFATGKPGTMVETYKGNSALWSLSYEWWFYLLYTVFRTRPKAAVEVGLLSFGAAVVYLISPFGAFLYVAYFALWWAGVSLAREWRDGGGLSMKGQRVSLLSVAAVAALFVGTKLRHLRPIDMGLHPALEARHLVFGVLMILLAILAFRFKWHRPFGRVFAPFAAIGSVSYALYVLHMPFVVIGGTFSPLPLLGRVLMLAGACVLMESILQPKLGRLLNPRPRRKLEELTPP